MKSFGDLASMAFFFGAMAKDIEVASHDGLEKAAVIVEDEAKSALGTYKYGWPALQPETVARKATGDSPLLETGALRDSIKHHVSGKSAFVGSDSDIAVYQDKGTSRIPPRPIFEPAAIAKEHEIVEAIGEAIMKKI